MTRKRILLTVIATSTLIGLTFASSAAAGTPCITVSGYYVEHDASGADCTSPVGLCIVAQYHGDLKGTLTGQATSVSATADTPTTSVLTFTTTSQFAGRLHARNGTLQIRNAGAFRTAGQGSIVDLQTIVSGTAGLVGATGEIRASGTYNTATGGRSVYNGTVCLP